MATFMTNPLECAVNTKLISNDEKKIPSHPSIRGADLVNFAVKAVEILSLAVLFPSFFPFLLSFIANFATSSAPPSFRATPALPVRTVLKSDILKRS